MEVEETVCLWGHGIAGAPSEIGRKEIRTFVKIDDFRHMDLRTCMMTVL